MKDLRSAYHAQRITEYASRLRTGALRIIVVLGLVMAGAAWSRALAGHDLSWHVVAGGGQDSASVAHAVRGTLGQLAIGDAAPPGSGHAMRAGYWAVIRPEAPKGKVYIYIPVVLKQP